MNNEKSLRDIWTVTDKMSLDVLNSAGGVPESCNASVITTASTATKVPESCKGPVKTTASTATRVSESCNASVLATASSKEKCESYISSQTQESYLSNNFDNLAIPCGLFLQPPKEYADEDDTMSLISSIWTPTLKDECVGKKDYQRNPLLVVKIPGKDSQQGENENPNISDDSCEKLLEIGSESDKKLLEINSECDEKLLEISSECDEKLLEISSESELSNNCGSDESQDELNDETFGESNSSKPEITMFNISEDTANYEVLNGPSQKNRKERRSESTDSNNSEKTIVEKHNDKSRKTDPEASFTRVNSETQTNQSNVKASRSRNHPKRRRNVDYKVLTTKFSHLGMESDEVLSVSRENLSIQELYSSNRNGGRTSNVKKNIAIETREVLGKKGSTKKITYVRGKIVEETNDAPNKNSKWNTDLCNLKIQNRNAPFPGPSPHRAPHTKLVEANSSRLSNSKDIPSFRQFKNGKLVFDDCLKMNGHLNFFRQEAKDSFPKKGFEMMKKETKKDTFHKPRYKNHIDNAKDYFPKKGYEVLKKDRFNEPRYKNHVENVRNNNHSTISRNIIPNYSAKAINRTHLERKVINSQNYKESFEEDMRSEVSWNVVTPEKEIQRETLVKKSSYKGTPTYSFAQSRQPILETNQAEKSNRLPTFSQFDKSCNDNFYDRFIFSENNKTTKQEDETETLSKTVPKYSFRDNQIKQGDQIQKSDRRPTFPQNDKSCNDNFYDRFISNENRKSVKPEDESAKLAKVVSKSSPQQIKKGDELPKAPENDEFYSDKQYENFVFQQYLKSKKEEAKTPNKFVSESLHPTHQTKKSEQMSVSSLNDKYYDQLNNRFIFRGNLNTVKKEETDTLPRFIPNPSTKVYRATESLSFVRSAKLKEERAQKKSLLVKDGKEVADLIVGCHTAVDVFSSFYHEWLTLRKESIELLEKIMVEIIKCARKNEKIRDVIAGLNIAAGAAGFTPYREVTLGAKIASAIGGFVDKILGGEFNEKDKNAKEHEVRQVFQKDIDTSSMVYIYGVQCSSQFEDTRHAVKALLQRTQDSFELFMSDTSVISFLKEISENSPSNATVFYRMLRCEYERLINKSKSDESKAFVNVFEFLPQAVSVIDLLPWKFEPDGFDNSIVQNAWEELFSLFNNKRLSSNDDFLTKIQNCLFFLKKEKAIVQKSVCNLLK